MENLRRFFSIFEVRGDNFLFNLVWLNVKYEHFFIAKLIICLAWMKKNALLMLKLKNCLCVFMSYAWTNTWGSLFSLFACFMHRRSWHGSPPFSNFLFTNLFSIKLFIISSLFHYFNLFVPIFIQSYANIKLHGSTL